MSGDSRRPASPGAHDARVVLGALLLASAVSVTLAVRAGDIQSLKVLVFLLVTAFVLWAVISEGTEWEGHAEQVARRRRRVPRGRIAPAPPAPVVGPPAPRGRRPRGPEGRSRRLRRQMAHPLGILLVLGCVIAGFVLCLVGRGCAAWPPFGGLPPAG